MFNIFKKRFKKRELIGSSSFIEMIKSAVDGDYECVSDEGDADGTTYFIYPETCYRSSDTCYGCIWVWREYSDPKRELIRILANRGGKDFELLNYSRILQGDAGYEDSEIQFTGFIVDSPSEALATCINRIVNTANFNNYKTPPPYVVALQMYASAS